MTKKQEQNERAVHAMELLKKHLKPGDTIYTVLRRVSKSGMRRQIDCYAIKENKPFYLSGYVEAIGLGKRAKDDKGLIVNGCGMDMGFHLVSNVSTALFGVKNWNALRQEWI